MMTGNGVMHNGTTILDEYGHNLDRLKVSLKPCSIFLLLFSVFLRKYGTLKMNNYSFLCCSESICCYIFCGTQKENFGKTFFFFNYYYFLQNKIIVTIFLFVCLFQPK